jgi:hypothetical protein
MVMLSMGEMMNVVYPRDSIQWNSAGSQDDNDNNEKWMQAERQPVATQDAPQQSMLKATDYIAHQDNVTSDHTSSTTTKSAFGTNAMMMARPRSTPLDNKKSGRLAQIERFRNRTASRISANRKRSTLLQHREVERVYKPTGGRLPKDDQNKNLNHDPRKWPSIDNGTCLGVSDEPPFEWQMRAPHAILLGTMKGGTHAVMDYLWQHPMVVESHKKKKELHFFDFDTFQRNESGIPQLQNQLAYADKFASNYPGLFTDPDKRIANKKNMFAIDDSPRYLLWSDRTPEAILCVTPWAKLMAIVRNPIDRAVSHFRFEDEARQRNKKPMVDWQVWIFDDFRLLKQAGVVRDWNKVDFDMFAGSDAEMMAWKKYLRLPNSNMILGRGLYAIQLEHYFAAMERAGKPRSELLVIQSEDLLTNTQVVYNHMLEFLELSPHQLEDAQPKHTTTEHAAPLPDDLRRELEAFYAPYNRRLYKLLQWDNVWDAAIAVDNEHIN